MRITEKLFGEPRKRRKRLFRRRLPLIACLGAGLMLGPTGLAGTLDGQNQQKPRVERRVKPPAKPQKRRVKRKGMFRQLGSSDVKAAVRAGATLSRRGSKAIPGLLKIIDNREREPKIAARALAVLYSMDWKKIGRAQKKLTVVKLFPILMKFTPTGRSPESKMAGWVMLRIGDEAMPAFMALLKSRYKILRFLGLSVLSEVDWSRISPKPSFAVMEVLKKMEKDEVKDFRDMAKELVKRIRRTHVICAASLPQGEVA